MAAFDPSAELTHQPDYRLVADTFITMFWDRAVLETTVNWLATNGYQIVTVPAGSWHSPADLHRDIAQALDFPGYYGKNLGCRMASFCTRPANRSVGLRPATPAATNAHPVPPARQSRRAA